MRRAIWATLAGIAIFSGCAADPRPSYVEPKLSDAQTATLTCGMQYYVSDVDGARVDSGSVMFSLAKNDVRVTPGDHRLTVGHVTGNGGSQTWMIKQTFLAGHTYEIAGSSMFGGLMITDRNTNARTVIQ